MCELVKEIAKQKVTKEIWVRCVEHCQKIENTYRSTGRISQEPFIIPIGDD